MEGKKGDEELIEKKLIKVKFLEQEYKISEFLKSISQPNG